MRIYRHVQKQLTDQWVRVGWSLQESYEAYLDRSLAERLILHDKLSEYMKQVYAEPQKQAKKSGL